MQPQDVQKLQLMIGQQQQKIEELQLALNASQEKLMLQQTQSLITEQQVSTGLFIFFFREIKF